MYILKWNENEIANISSPELLKTKLQEESLKSVFEELKYFFEELKYFYGFMVPLLCHKSLFLQVECILFVLKIFKSLPRRQGNTLINDRTTGEK